MLLVIAHARAVHPGLPLWIGGFSFGGAVALAAAGQTKAEELILVAPSLKRLAQWQPTATEPTPAANTLVIHGERDDTVPLSDSLDWARPRGIPVTVVPGADHFFHQRLHLIRLIVSRWVGARR
jgi:alpha/beta superfamily hydrolase